eukprot:403368858
MQENQKEIETELDIQKYGKYYNMFFGSGAAGLVALTALLIYIGRKRYQRYNPIGIMFNQIVVQIALSFRLFLVGLLFQIWEYDFISLQIDGTTRADFYCSFEGLYYYAFHLCEILWGLLWLYDFQILIKSPSIFTGKYLLYYSLAVYFTSFGFSIVVFFQDQGNFTSAANLMCFVIDDNSIGYYLLFNIPILLYVLFFFYTYCVFGRPINKRHHVAQKAVGGDQESLIQKNDTIGGISTQLHLKLYYNMQLQTLYFVLWFISVIPNFFILDPVGLKWYSFFSCIHPIVIIILVMKSLAIGAQNLERQGVISGQGKSDQKPEKNESGTELSDYSSMSDISMVDMPQGGQNVTYRQFMKERFNQFTDIDSNIVTKDQLESFRMIIKENILESIIRGFQSLQSKQKSKNLYDKELGYGEAPIDTHLGLETQLQKKEKISGTNYIVKHIKEFLAFNRQGVGAQISPKDPNAEALVIEGQVLGHPDIIKRFNVAIKFDELNKQSKVEKVTQSINEVEDFSYDFVELAPEIFSIIRKINNIDEETLKLIFSMENIDNLKVDVSSTKGGVFYIFPEQGGLVLKSISKASYKEMQDFIPDYYKHILMNPHTKLTPVLGVYNMKLKRDGESMHIYFVLQRNIQDFDDQSLEEDDFSFGFDIKGSVQGRKHLDNPRDILNFGMVIHDKKKYKYKLKDQDFLQSFKQLDITQNQSERIIAQIESDVDLLSRYGFMDYSLFLVVVIKPIKQIDFVKQEKHSLDIFNQHYSYPDMGMQTISSGSKKRLFIGETDPALLKRRDAADIILLKEQSNLRTKFYHICDTYDIVSVRQFEEDTLNGGESKRTLQDFKTDVQDGLNLNTLSTLRGNSVINFIRTDISYEFSKQKIDDDQKCIRNTQMAAQKQLMEQRQKEEEERKKKADLLAQLNQFYADPNQLQSSQSNYNSNLLASQNQENPVKCYSCRQNKLNHIVSEHMTQDAEMQDDIIRKKLLKLSKRDVIEQVIFDPQLGIVKREIHYGIIDYLTVSLLQTIYFLMLMNNLQTYPMKRRLDELMHQNSREITAVRPNMYGERFLKTMKKVFQ